jgi:WD40 repeat protein
MEDSAPHVYLSAFPWVSKSSEVSQLYLSCFKSISRIQSSETTNSIQQLYKLEGHTSAVESVCFSDGKYLASGSLDNTICLWNVATGGQEGMPFKGHTEAVVSVCFSPDC